MGYKETIIKVFDLQKFGMKFGLDSMKSILKKLGNPDSGGKYIHLAGTNGKGSTAAMVSSILREAGFSVGLFTSPHLVTFKERIQISGVLVTEEEVVELAEEVWQATDKDNPPTFFEFVGAMAFLYFKKHKVDIAVIETGLGGRLDSTNVIVPLVTAITNISLEHTEHLGNTIEEIAFEKAGIIKPKVPFVGGRLCRGALEVIRKRLLEVGARGKFFEKDYFLEVLGQQDGFPIIDYKGPLWSLSSLSLGLVGEYQADNAALALAILEELQGLGFKVTETHLRAGLSKVNWPGRGEIFPPQSWPSDHRGVAPLILDGAHNPDGAEAFGNFLRHTKKKKLHLIVGVMADKDIKGVLTPIIDQADSLYLTRPEYFRAASPELLLEKIRLSFGEPKNLVGLYPLISEALIAASVNSGPEDLVVVSGSLFTVGEARAYLLGEKTVESN
jgi:dihydrofolate synthase/folylpolyglutamate synthase